MKQRTNLISLLVACLILFGSCLLPMPVRSSTRQEAADVVSAEGVIVPWKEAALGFKAAGRVQEVLVSEGDRVTANQILARLETRDLEQAVLQAEAKLLSAQAELTKAQEGARPEEITTAEAALFIAQARVKSAQSAAGIAESSLEEAQVDVAAAEGAVDVAMGRQAAAQAALNSAQSNLDKLLAGATRREINIAEKRIERLKARLWGLQSQRDEGLPGVDGDIAVLEEQIRISELELAKLKDPPRTEDVSVARAQVSQARANLQTAQARVARAQTGVAQAQAGVQIAAAQLAQTEAEVESAQAQVVQARAELDLIKAGSRKEDIASAEAVVAQAEVTLAKAKSGLEDAILRAPFDGTVGTLLVDKGELVPPYMAVMRLGDLNQLQVKTEDLSEVDIDQVAVGQVATVTVDALGGSEFEGTVLRIAPLASEHRGDTVYEVTVDLGVGPESGLRWGMSAFVEIHTQ